ncbi:MAG: ABC transporter ATP-binding protein [Reyranella sp.]|uniref:ABC transporter ATP-binding protein n=1 Tax=Reyranella sp. TaxID=1929291 RepID=UPI0025CCA597|nr:ABC transporter ATP-binding protein [Reyranella sp.]MBR2818359.1 ABC transporter ATP-binding protein [Reyranella sp.]
MSTTRIEVQDLVVRYGDQVAVNGVSFTVGRGEHLTLLGPSGCGKTTTLRAVAGLEHPSGGSIRIDGQTMYDSAQRKNVQTEQRGVSMVFQSYAVWPHMSVFDNVAYGLRVRKLGAAAIKENVERALDLVQMRHLADRGASKLSGGQQQRVALARAIAFSPTVVLFDEPLSNLDAKLRAEMRVELRELQRRLGITSVYVTHDQEEALAISDRVIVMNVGVIEQIGTPEEIYNKPRSRFVADFVGSANLIKGKPVGEGLFAVDGGPTLKVTAPHRPHGKESEVAVRTAYIDLEARPGDNHVPGKVRQRLFHGDFVQYVIDSPVGALIVRRPPVNLLGEGAEVTLSFSPEHCVLLEA